MKLNKFSMVIVFLLSLSLFSCSDDDNQSAPNYVAFDKKEVKFGLSEGEETSKTIDVYTSNVTGEDRVFPLEIVDGATMTNANPLNYTLPLTVTVPANTNKGVITMNIKNVDLSAVVQFITVKFVANPSVSTGKAIKINLSEVCNLNTVVFSLTLDAYGSETTWALYSGTDEVPLFSGGPYTDGGTAGSQTWCLPNGDYTFLIEDVYGDGIAPAGSYKITKTFADGSPSVVLASGGAFASFETKTFTLN